VCNRKRASARQTACGTSKPRAGRLEGSPTRWPSAPAVSLPPPPSHAPLSLTLSLTAAGPLEGAGAQLRGTGSRTGATATLPVLSSTWNQPYVQCDSADQAMVLEAVWQGRHHCGGLLKTRALFRSVFYTHIFYSGRSWHLALCRGSLGKSSCTSLQQVPTQKPGKQFADKG
jgi:hypothetical protein